MRLAGSGFGAGRFLDEPKFLENVPLGRRVELERSPAVDVFGQALRQPEVLEDSDAHRHARVHDVNERARAGVDPRENLADVGACVPSHRRSRESRHGDACRAALGLYALRPRKIR